jgi:hypothetical protein
LASFFGVVEDVIDGVARGMVAPVDTEVMRNTAVNDNDVRTSRRFTATPLKSGAGIGSR